MKSTWRSVNDYLHTLSEDEVLQMLDEERSTHKRVSMLERLHQRYSSLRTTRERLEILREARQV